MTWIESRLIDFLFVLRGSFFSVFFVFFAFPWAEKCGHFPAPLEV